MSAPTLRAFSSLFTALQHDLMESEPEGSSQVITVAATRDGNDWTFSTTGLSKVQRRRYRITASVGMTAETNAETAAREALSELNRLLRLR